MTAKAKAKTKTITRAAFFKQDDTFKYEEVYIPEWKAADGSQGVMVKFRSLSARHQDMLEVRGIEMQKGDEDPSFQALLVAMSAIDDKGKRLFVSADIPAIGDMDDDIIGRLYKTAAKACGMGKEEDEKAVEDFGDAQDEGSSTDSA